MPYYPVHETENKQAVISLGGSLIVPDEVNVEYLSQFVDFINGQVALGWRFFIITGGGAPARRYIDAARAVMKGNITKDDMDWLGIHATRFNAHLVRTLFRDIAQPVIITDPETDEIHDSKIVVVSGWKPGWSTDFVATKIAQRINAPYLFNLSNITQVYSDDPRKNPDVKAIDHINWTDFRKMVGDEWTPGLSSPFDPIAAKLADEENRTVLVMNGADLPNIESALTTGNFIGTVISNSPAE
jgi:uridylate kinase